MSTSHNWKGGCWSLLVQKDTAHSLGYFLGLTTTPNMKPGYRINVRFGFTFESATSQTLELQTIENYLFDSSGETYKDNGHTDASLSLLWDRFVNDSPCYFRCNMTENEVDVFTAGLLNMSGPELDVRYTQGDNLDESYNLDFPITKE